MSAVQLSEITESIEYGVTASASEQPVGPKFLRITDIQNGSVEWGSVPFCDAKEKKLNNSKLQPGDIVFARTGATTGKSFLIKECPEDAVFASYLIRVRPSNNVDPSYLSHFFQSDGYWRQISLKSAGAAQPGVNSTKLKELEIPLPPLDEQRRIAAILDQADTLRRQRQRAIDHLNMLGQAIFHEMFSKTIEPTPIQDLLKEEYLLLHKDGNHGGNYPRKEEFGEEGVPFLSAKCIDDFGGFIDGELQFLNDEKANSLRIGWISDGDVLLSHNASVGKVAAYRGEYGDALIGTSLTCFRPNPEKLKTDFLAHALQSYEFQSQLTKNMSQTTRNQVPITAQKRLFLSIPPVSDQVEFDRRVSSAVSMRSKMLATAEQTETLFSSLQNRAFRGEL
ncbi:MAG: restriction endonuclease subunit S [Sulfitobacter sp.]|uniref:restriction endonuclease subunit S n=1 Tax=Sulfitobacter sp. TaxID=1903071 RepID=UPI0040597D9E